MLAANGPGGLLTCALRPHLIWGPRDQHLVPRMLARAATGRLRRIGDGANLIDTVYVENAAEAHLLAARALRARIARGRPGLLHQPGRAGELLAVDRRDPGPGRHAAGPQVDVVAGCLGDRGIAGMVLPRASPGERAADDAIPGRPTGALVTISIFAAPARTSATSPQVSFAEGMRRLAASWQRGQRRPPAGEPPKKCGQLLPWQPRPATHNKLGYPACQKPSND